MKRNFTKLLLSAVLMMCCTVGAYSASGDGSQNNPYLLANYDDLLWFAGQVNNQERTDICAKLTADIVATGTWTPIGTPEKMYTGDFNGDGYTISGLTLNNTEQSCVGLFGKVDSGSHIHHVGVTDCNFIGDQFVGAICGDFAAGSIEYCFCSGSVKAADAAGGIVGSCYTNASIMYCHTSCSVSTNQGNYGGICGALYGTIGYIAVKTGCCGKLTGFVDPNAVIKFESEGSILSAPAIKDFSSSAFYNGELCWWLNKETIDGTQAWYQDVSNTNSIPKPSNRYPTLYCHTDIWGTPVYSNVFDWHIYGTPPDDEFWYTTTDGKPVGIDLEKAFEETVTNTYHNGKGVIKSVNGNDLDEIKDYAFKFQNNLKAVSMGREIDKIGTEAFCLCHQLTEVSLSPELESIGMGSFDSCENLNLVELWWEDKSDIASLYINDFYASFNECYKVNLRSVYLNPSAYEGTGWEVCPIYRKYQEGDCFTCTYHGTAVRYRVTSYSPANVTVDRVEFLAQNGVVELPETVTYPGMSISYTVTGISENAFKDCTDLVDVTIPKTVTSIGASAFSGCTGITTLTLPEKLTSIGASAFSGCTSLRTLNVQWRDASKVVTPGENAFANCVSGGQTIKLNIPYSIKTACESIAPYNDTNIFNLHWWTMLSASGMPVVTPKAFDGNTKLTAENINLSQCQLTNIEPGDEGKVWLTAVAEYDGLWPVEATHKVTVTYGLGMNDEIADKYRIEQTAAIDNVGFIAPDHPVVGWEFFYKGVRYRITGISPNTVSIPDHKTLEKKESVDGDLIIPESIYDPGTNASYALTYIGMFAFDGCKTLKTVDIPGTVKSIGYRTFYNTSATSVTLHEGLEYIDNQAFSGGNFTSITIPASVKIIEPYAFSYCKSLSSVTFNSLPILGGGEGSRWGKDESFKNCNSLSTKILDLTDSDKPYIGTSLNYYPGDFTEARYHRTLVNDGTWGTIVLPFKPASTKGLKFYALQSMATGGEEGGSLTFMKVDAPDAGVPYLFRNEGESADFTLTAETPSSIVLNTEEIGTDFKMKGSFQQKQLNGAENGNLYYLSGNQFYHANGKINIAPFRAYIEGSSTSNVKSFVLVVSDNGEDITAIPGILTDGSIDETEAIYDLNGRRLTTPVKGQVNVIRTKSGKTIKVNFANRAQ